jgi:hypothetical protein
MAKLSRELLRQAMAAMGSKGGKRSLETMTAAERTARAKIAATAAAKKRTAERIARERQAKDSKPK